MLSVEQQYYFVFLLRVIYIQTIQIVIQILRSELKFREKKIFIFINLLLLYKFQKFQDTVSLWLSQS